MLIKTLLENTAIPEDLGCEHGLSLYIEALGHKLLFDTGASGLFAENAQKMGVDLAEVEFLIISHGHYDHGGGLHRFFELNDQAEVFIHPLGFEKYYARNEDGSLRDIGIDPSIQDNRRIVLTSDRFTITRGIRVFSNVSHVEALPASNRDLLMEQEGEVLDDTFLHEQNLVIEDEGKMVLLTGCAHNGIVNIVKHFYELKGRYPDVVLGGFHLSKSEEDHDSFPEIDRIAKILLETGAKYYTGHCTGITPYERLKEKMGDRIDYLSTGTTLII